MARPQHLPADQIIRAYRAGQACRALAQQHCCTVPGILRVLRREGVRIRPRGATRTRSQEAIQLYQELEHLLVFVVDQEQHHVGARMARGMTNAQASRVLQEHQQAQQKPAIYLWRDEVGLPGIRAMLQHRNGTDESARVHARACEVLEVPAQEAQAFYDLQHLQGACASSRITLGLRHQDAWVAMMSFHDPSACRGIQVPWMLQRYACTGRVPGAASRLLTCFRREHVGQIVSYSDNRYSPTGGLYSTLGFALLRQDPPDYRYWRDGRWYAKSSKQRKNLIRELGGCTEQDTEFTMAARAGYMRCYDCGKKTWLLG